MPVFLSGAIGAVPDRMKISLNTLTRKKSVIFRIAYRSITGSSNTPNGQSSWYQINRLGAGFIYNHITSKSPRH